MPNIVRHWGLGMLLLFCWSACATPPQKAPENLKEQGAALRDLGEAYMLAGDFTSALKKLLEAEKRYPQDPILHNYLGLTYLEKKKPDLAIAHFKKAIALKPDYTPAKNNLGTAYLAKNDWDAAIAVLQEITGDLLYATPQYPLLNLGWAYYNKKEYGLAEKYYHEALQARPRYVEAMRGLGRTYLAMGKPGEAVGILEKGLKLAPAFLELYFDLAQAYGMRGESAKAAALYTKVLELAPGSPYAAQASRLLNDLK